MKKIRRLGDRTGISKPGNFFINRCLYKYINENVRVSRLIEEVRMENPGHDFGKLKDEIFLMQYVIGWLVPVIRDTLAVPCRLSDLIDRRTGRPEPGWDVQADAVSLEYSGNTVYINGKSRSLLAYIQPEGDGLIRIRRPNDNS